MAAILAMVAPATAPEPVETSPGRMGSLYGRITVERSLPPPAPAPSVAALGMAPAPAAPDRRRSVVYFETAPQGAFDGPDWPPVTIDQRQQAFVPHVLAIPAGTTVVFPNNDRTYHNVFSLSKAKRFDLGRYPRGQSRSVRFDQPGVVRLFCEIHSHMNAFVLVFAHRYFAVTDPEGRYRIRDIPPGAYTLVVWNDGAERERRRVRIPDEGGAVELDVTVR